MNAQIVYYVLNSICCVFFLRLNGDSPLICRNWQKHNRNGRLAGFTNSEKGVHTKRMFSIWRRLLLILVKKKISVQSQL